MRAFVHLREMVSGHAELVRRLAELEKKYDTQFRRVFEAIRALINEDIKPRRRIGFSGSV